MKISRKITTIAMMLCLAIVLHLLEQLIPLPTSIPGAKLGLANIVTLVAIFMLKPIETIAFVVVRVFVTTFLTAGPTAFLFSLAGAAMSTAIMYGAVFILGPYLSLPTISILGAIAHNIGQLIMASIILQTGGIIYYLPVLMGSALISGLFIGLLAGNILKFMYNKDYIRFKKAYLTIVS